MSDYSNLKFEKVDDLPDIYRSPRQSKPLGPVDIFTTLPFINDMEIGETIKFTIPDDGFGYNIIEDAPTPNQKYGPMKSALTRTFQMLAQRKGLHFVYRLAEEELYIKRIEG